MPPVPKYRVSLSLQQLQWIAQQARQAPETATTVELYRTAVIQITKIEAAAIKPAFTTTATPAPAVVAIESDHVRYARLIEIPESERTEEQVAQINEYRYFNDLMPPDEEASYVPAGTEED